MATTIRLALVGTRTDRLRVLLTACSAALATIGLLAVATVLAIKGGLPPGGGAGVYGRFEVIPEPGAEPGAFFRALEASGYAHQYSNNLLVEPGLRSGVAVGLFLLCIPLLTLAVQCARLGAPARDRRLAAFRLAGATPGQVRRITLLETGLATGTGAVLGLAAYLVLRVVLHRSNDAGQLLLPTDLLPSVIVIALIVVGLPAAAMLITRLLLRRINVGPLGVRRRVRRKPVRPWPGVLIAAGVGCVAVVYSGDTAVDSDVLVVLFVIGLGLAVIGIVLGTGWICHATGRIMARLARGPAALLAAKRLVADPWAISRSCSAILATLLIGAFAAAMRAQIIAHERAERIAYESLNPDWPYESSEFYANAYQLVDGAIAVAVVVAVIALLIAVVDGMLMRKRTYAALNAAGVPNAVLGRSVLWHAAVPVAVAAVLAIAIGVTVGWFVVGDTTVSTTMGECVVVEGVERDCVEYTGSADVTFPWLPILGWWTLAVGLVAALSALVGWAMMRRGLDVAELRTA